MSKKHRPSGSIRAELEKTSKRLAELQPQLDDLNEKYNTSEKAFAAKKIAFEDLQMAQAGLTSMEGVVNRLLQTAGSLQAELDVALKAEDRVDAIQGLKSTAEDAQTAFNVYTERRSELNDLIGKLEDARLAFREKQTDFASQFRVLVPGMAGFRGISKAVRPLIDQAKAEIGVSDETFNVATQLYPATPALAYGAAVDAAERAIAHTANQEAERQRSRQRDAAAAKAGQMREAAEAAFTEQQKERAKKQWRWPAGSRQDLQTT